MILSIQRKAWAILWNDLSVRAYLRQRKRMLLMQLLFLSLFCAVFLLYAMPLEGMLYALCLCFLLAGAGCIWDFTRFCRRHRTLRSLLICTENAAFSLPEPESPLEADYQTLLTAVCAYRAALSAKNENRYQDLTEYFPLWAHQIKTPIAAMQLLLQQNTSAHSRELSAELFKLDQYVEMVLSYLRLGSDSTDYLFRRCCLDDIVRACLRKYARLFILKKISLSFQETQLSVLTDEKWLQFALEQILSNAAKYTRQGGVTIRLSDPSRPELVIQDSGIGIQPEDLPRVTDWGYTGQNGHSGTRSTGIGLALCRETLEMLGHRMRIESTPGVGTSVYLDFSRNELEIF